LAKVETSEDMRFGFLGRQYDAGIKILAASKRPNNIR
jgi:hypothetical protein